MTWTNPVHAQTMFGSIIQARSSDRQQIALAISLKAMTDKVEHRLTHLNNIAENS